jgi:two-component system, NarL family, nitrate/nitrite response regulator NarL
VAEEHALFRRAVVVALEAQAGIEIIVEAGGVDEASESVAALQPQVLFLDLSLPVGGAVPLVARLARTAPATAVVVTVADESEAAAYARTRRCAREPPACSTRTSR